jgi:hypothetical protein
MTKTMIVAMMMAGLAACADAPPPARATTPAPATREIVYVPVFLPTSPPPAHSAPTTITGNNLGGSMTPNTAAQPDEHIYYGSRAGMHLTTVSKQGIGTANAVIMVKHTPEDAKAFCVNYALDNSMACVRSTVAAVKVGDRVTGNCVTKTWTDMNGTSYAFLGRAKKSDNIMAEYALKELKTGEILDGSSASGYGVHITIFQQLCPGLAR